jgi:ABC-type sugar transport system ATPase subunit
MTLSLSTPSAAVSPSHDAGVPFLRVENLSKQFGTIEALRDVTLDVRRGEVLGLLGDNGAGKSTLIKCVAGVHQPNSGVIRCDGSLVNISNPERARRLGIEPVFQDLALIPNLSVSANLFIGREMESPWFGKLAHVLRKKAMDEASRQILAKLDIHIPNVRMTVDSLSGGQRQAIAIARAQQWKANLVILDEPTAALSVPEQRKVLALARQLASQDVAVIFITHNILDVLAVTDRIAILHRGSKAAELWTRDTNEHEIVSLIMGKTSKAA